MEVERVLISVLLLVPFKLVVALHLSNAESSLTNLFQNNLNVTDRYRHFGVILLDPQPIVYAANICSSIGKHQLTQDFLQRNSADLARSITYLSYTKVYPSAQRYLLGNNITVSITRASTLSFDDHNVPPILPILCTASPSAEIWLKGPAPSRTLVTISAARNMTYTGFHTAKAFNFHGISYADPYRRWEYTSVNSATNQVVDATVFGPPCPTAGASKASEQCLTLNIKTPYLPSFRANFSTSTRPVLFWIHGGGYEKGDGSDPQADGSNLASREDIVTVTVNYRLGTFGFLAIPGLLDGNYGIGDIITALKWVKENIAYFGGDPRRITIAGESAGAAAVRVLLGSPVARPLFSQAIVFSSPGGGDTLGRQDDMYPYSHYMSINESFTRSGSLVLRHAGCTQDTAKAQLDCLRLKDTKTIQSISFTNAKFVVQDGKIVTTSRLDFANPGRNTDNISVIIGGARNDGASFSKYPRQGTTNLAAGLAYGLGISAPAAQRIIASNQFPYYNTRDLRNDIFNVTQRIATDDGFRCEAQATIYAGVKSSTFTRGYAFEIDRTWGGFDPNRVADVTVAGEELPYYSVHTGGMPHIFGNAPYIRDAEELMALRFSVASFAAFVRTGNAVPDLGYLDARGYEDVAAVVRRGGGWKTVEDSRGPVQLLGRWPPASGSFTDAVQCAWLGYPVDKYVRKGQTREKPSTT